MSGEPVTATHTLSRLRVLSWYSRQVQDTNSSSGDDGQNTKLVMGMAVEESQRLRTSPLYIIIINKRKEYV